MPLIPDMPSRPTSWTAIVAIDFAVLVHLSADAALGARIENGDDHVAAGGAEVLDCVDVAHIVGLGVLYRFGRSKL